MALTERLAILITANGAQAMSEFQRTGRAAERSMRSIDDRTQQIGAGLTRAGAAMVGFGAVTALGMFKAAQAAEEQRLAVISLQNALSNSPVITNASTAAFEAQADALQQVTVAGDEEIVAAQARLATFRVTRDEIQGLTPLIVDYARQYGVDLVSAANNVGKAMMGNVGALQRQGVFIDENVYATDRYTAVMQALRENAGGFAEAEGATFTGQLEIMKNRLGEVAEGVGVGAVDAFSNLLGAVEGVSAAFGSTSAGSQAFVGQLLTYGAIGVTASGALSLIAGGLVRFAGQAKAAADAAYMLYLRVRTSNLTMGQIAGRVGAAGAALAVVSVAWMRHADEQARVAAQSEAVRAAFAGEGSELKQLATAIGELTEGFNQASGDELTAAMRAAGLGVRDLADALNGSEADLDAFMNKLIETGEISEDTRPFVEQAMEAFAWSDNNTTVTDLDRLASALGVLRDEAAAVDQEEELFAGIGAGATDAAEAIDELRQSMDDFFASTFGVERAQDAVAESADALLQSLLENGPILQGMSVEARNNRAAFDEWSVAIGTAATEIAEYGAGALAAAGYIDQQRASLARARDMGLISTATFQHYDGVLRGIRREITTSVATPGLPGATSAMRELRGLADNLNGRTVRFTTIADVVGLDAMRELRGLRSSWSGGPVPGGGSEGVPRMLHGGEYVLSADVVDRIKRGDKSRGARMDTAGSSGGGVVVHIHGDVYDADRLADKIGDALRKRERAVAA